MNFESKIQQTISGSDRTIDKEKFINNLTEARYKQKLKRSQAISGILAICLIIIVGIASYIELDQGAIYSGGNFYFSDSNISNSDFDEYNLNNDYFIDDLAIYIIEEEDDIWTAFSFLDEIEYDNFINYMEEES
ncbi:MAG: hypothetical protein VYA09_02920 [Candidatus Neomarinimicrobiota bacterium]|nr:hypothetical protein [Candidatus Neomarinimicrobiota bacterium]MEC9274363.1 hypothetical protein [Candidatus Neomarinimicrobiota bacterium]MEE3195415.1 hypothetical protein [Candidatus Neomarinimicrobiota bacterium]